VKLKTKCHFCGREGESDLLNWLLGNLGMFRCTECIELLDRIGVNVSEIPSREEAEKFAVFKNGPAGHMMRGKLLEIIGQHTAN